MKNENQLSERDNSRLHKELIELLLKEERYGFYLLMPGFHIIVSVA